MEGDRKYRPRTIEGTSVRARLWPHAHGTHRARKEKGGWERERERERERRGGADLLSREEADRSSQPRSVTDGHESSGQPRTLPKGGICIQTWRTWWEAGREGEKERGTEGARAHARTRGRGIEGGDREIERRGVWWLSRHPAGMRRIRCRLEEGMRGGGGRETERAREREREREGGGDGYRAAAE